MGFSHQRFCVDTERRKKKVSKSFLFLFYFKYAGKVQGTAVIFGLLWILRFILAQHSAVTGMVGLQIRCYYDKMFLASPQSGQVGTNV